MHSQGCEGFFQVNECSPILMEVRYENISESEIASGPRIGVDYSGECAAWPWRFWLKNTPFVKKTINNG
ncbi:MAG: DNA-3-methyladenine glycosylase [Saprospiraceae bacterium]